MKNMEPGVLGAKVKSKVIPLPKHHGHEDVEE
jgi:hypothetical protein